MEKCIESINEYISDGYAINHVLVSPDRLLTIEFSKNYMLSALPFRGADIGVVEQYLRKNHTGVVIREI